MTRALAITALLLVACAAQKPPTKPAKVAPAAITPTHDEVTPTTCVQACTERRRMEAMGWEAIVAGCERECAEGDGE